MGLPLITIAEYKAYAGLNNPNEDERIKAIIPKATELVKTICRRTFVDYVNDNKVEYFDGGTRNIVPTEIPVLNLVSFEQSLDYGNTYQELKQFVDFTLVRSTHELMVINRETFTYHPNGYRLTYSAGYEELPSDLKLACMDLVTYYLRNEMAVHSPKAPGTNTVQIEYITTTALPAHIKRVLDQYTIHYA